MGKVRGVKHHNAGHFKKGYTPWNKRKHSETCKDTRKLVSTTCRHCDPQPGPSTSGSEEPHVVSGTQTVRHDHIKYKEITKKGKYKSLPVSIPAADGSQGTAMILRPAQVTEPSDDECKVVGNPVRETIDGNIVVHKALLMTAVNSAIQKHGELSHTCKKIELDICKVVPIGPSLRCCFKCVNCTFTSERHRLYEVIDTPGPGPKPAKINRSLQYALQDTPIGNERARVVIAGLQLRPGSRSGMTKSANKVGADTKAMNEADMDELIDRVKDINEARGLSKDAPIAAESDVRYDGSSMRSKYHPGLSASQGIGLTLENVTDKKYIIAAHLETKLCPTGSKMRAKGHDVVCPGGHTDCTSTIAYSENVSEKRIGFEMGKQLAKQKVIVSHLTTDSGAGLPAGMEQAMQASNPTFRLLAMKDMVHLGQSQRKKIMKAKFSKQMFGDDLNYQSKIKSQQALASDLPHRCAIIHGKMSDYYEGNMVQVAKHMPKAIEAMVNCYSGEHHMCTNSVFGRLTCGGKHGTWFSQSNHLKGQKMSKFNPSDSDKSILLDAINIRLGPDGLKCTEQRSSTQGCESRNSGLSTSLPKNKRHPRNAISRMHSAIHRLNHGAYKSMKLKLQYGECSIPHDSPAMKVFKDQEHRHQYSVAYKKKPSTIRRERALRRAIVSNYYERNMKKNDPNRYLKLKLENEMKQQLNARKRKRNALRREMMKKILKLPNTLRSKAMRDAKKRLDRDIEEAKGLIRPCLPIPQDHDYVLINVIYQ